MNAASRSLPAHDPARGGTVRGGTVRGAGDVR